MKIIGIVAEYNPFHNGHLHQINTVKQSMGADAVIVVMSGHFAQRGIPCITDKYTRARMALLNGVDLVLELPVPFATSSAQYFAEASISILHHSKSIHTLCFGSEQTELKMLEQVATLLSDEPPLFSQHLQSLLSTGMSYPRARQEALVHYFKQPELGTLLQQPNVILGIEYIKALIKYKSTIHCAPIERIVSGYHDLSLEHQIASASAIRHAFYSGDKLDTQNTLPSSSYDLLNASSHTLPHLNDFSELLKYRGIFSTVEDLYALWDIPKNLCHSIFQCLKMQLSLEATLNTCTSKTYSRATVQRAILRILLNLKSETIHPLQSMDWTPYIRVLACHPNSKHVLSYLCKHADVPVITSLSKHYNKLTPLQKPLLDYELQASQLYALVANRPELIGSDFSTPLFPFELS